MKAIRVMTTSVPMGLPAMAEDDKIIVGFATAESGCVQADAKPAQDAAMIRIARSMR